MTSSTPLGAIVPQHLVLVLPSTGEFDSRTYRIATTAIARGHQVTVIARAQGGLPTEELHPAGYRILRVAASTADGLPLPGVRGWIGRLLRRRRGLPATTVAAGPSDDGGAGGGPDDGGVSASATTPEAGAGRRASLPRRALAGLIRRLAIPLTIRSHRNNARAVAPRGDLYHGMAYMGIPVALGLGARDGAPVVYDARDIYVHARNIARLPGPARRLFRRVERRWARSAKRVMTVNRPYADVMARSFGVPLPAIVMNCSYRREPPATAPRRFHEALALGPTARVVLYQGGLAPDRGIEQLIEALPSLAGNVHLCLLGYGPLEPNFVAEARRDVHRGRLHVLPAVPPDDLLEWVASADIVAMPIQPSTLNHRLTTPNKLFEAMAAGVPVVASDLPGMAPIVGETGCGVVCDPTDPAAIADAVRSIFALPAAERKAMAGRALAAAAGPYSWEAQVEVLLAEYGRLTGRPW